VEMTNLMVYGLLVGAAVAILMAVPWRYWRPLE
jgi:hypothetical protein